MDITMKQINISDLLILLESGKICLRMSGKSGLGFLYSDKQLLSAMNNILSAIGELNIKVKKQK